MFQRKQVLHATTGSAAAAIVLLSAFIVWKEWREARLLMAASVRNTALVLALQVENALDQADGLLLSLRQRYLEAVPGRKAELDRLARQVRQEIPYCPLVARVGLTDARGRVLLHTGLADSPGRQIDLADRDYFRRARDGEQGLIFAGPLQVRWNGEWGLLLARGIRDSQGRFLGVTFAILPVATIGRSFARMDLGSAGSINLRTRDFAEVVRFPALPGANQSIGNRNISRTVQDLIRRQPGLDHYLYQAVAPIDGIERVYAYQAFPHSPFWMTVGRSVGDFRSSWRLTAALLGALSLAMGWLLLWGTRRFDQQNESLRRRIGEEEQARSKLRASEAALQVAAERFRQVSEAAQEWIWEVDADGLYTYASPVVERLLGYAPADLEGRLHYDDLWPPETRPQLLEGARRSFAAREPFHNFPNACLHRAGHLVHLETTGLPILGPDGALLGYRGVDRDVSEREAALQALRESESRFRQFFQRAPVSVWEEDFSAVHARFQALRAAGVHDLREHLRQHPEELGDLVRRVRVLAVNEATLALLGVARREDFNFDLGAHLTPQSMATFAELLAVLYDGGTRFEAESVRRDSAGRPLDVLVRASILPGHEAELSRLLIILVDLTARKAAEAERNQLERELDHLQRLDSLGRLAAGVSHDINNVLGTIMGVASVLKARDPDGSRAGRDADLLLRAAIRGRDLVGELQKFSRKELTAAEELDLNTLARQEAELLERTTLKKVQVLLDLAPHLPPVSGEAGTISNALMNLCVNALDAMPQGGRLTLATLDLGQGFVELSVTDTGEGMPPPVLARALEPFFTTKAPGQGTGLGLAQAYGAMKAHGGNLELQSEPGRGTRVALTFPTAASLNHPAPVTPEAEAEPAPGRTALAVLVVDDEDLFRSTARLMLETLGHRVEAATSAREGLERLRTGPPPDLVLLDLNMPELDGATALPQFQTLCPGLPVLLNTGFADDRVPDLLKRFPAVRLLRKPFTLQELRAALAVWP